jgi:heme/copper-type cytochrome/quinol oxidase subunit 4
MSEHGTKNKEQEEITLVNGFMGFLIITAAIYGLYFLPTLTITAVDIVRNMKFVFWAMGAILLIAVVFAVFQYLVIYYLKRKEEDFN